MRQLSTIHRHAIINVHAVANNSSPKALIVLFLVASAVFTIMGTITVAFNYYKSSVIAKAIVKNFNPDFSIPFNEREQFIDLTKQLTSRWYLTAGLIAYVLGAIFGLCAGLAAIYKW
jgi:hypothetical protein